MSKYGKCYGSKFRQRNLQWWPRRRMAVKLPISPAAKPDQDVMLCIPLQPVATVKIAVIWSGQRIASIYH